MGEGGGVFAEGVLETMMVMRRERGGREAGEGGGGEESKSKRKGIDRVGQVNLVKVKQKPKRKILNNLSMTPVTLPVCFRIY